MSEAPAEAAEAQQPAETTDQPQGEPQDSTDWKAEARKWEQRAKENREAAKELEKQRQASMTEAERAVAEAEQRGRQTAVAEYSKRLARSEIRAAAAGKDLDGVFDYIDLARFVGDDGEPDSKAIEAFVRALPEKKEPVPSFDGGSRTTPPAPQSMTGLIRKAAGRA